MDWGTWGVCLERNSETAGHGKGTSITGGTKKRGQDPFLLVVPTEPGAELHEGCQCIASGGWQGHMGLQHLLQQCQHLLFLHLKGLGFLTAPLQQEVPIFSNAPGCHLYQWLLRGRRTMLSQVLGPLPTPTTVTCPYAVQRLWGLERWGREMSRMETVM